MQLFEHPIYSADLNTVIHHFPLQQLKGKSVLITGSTGLIGSAIVDLLLAYNTQGGNIHIYAATLTKALTDERFGQQRLLTPVLYNALEPVHFDFHADFIIHAASPASPDLYIKTPVDTMLANIHGLDNLMKYAIHTHSDRVVYISSSEMYGKIEQSEAYYEDQQGYIDPLSIRSSYSMAKRAAETLCIAYAAQYKCHISMVRPGHIYGPTCTPSDHRVSSDFPRLAAAGLPIIMKSAGTQLRSYCYCLDCASAILHVLLHGENSTPYNISNKNSIITIRKMAEIITSYADVPLIMEIPSNSDRIGFNPMDNASLNSSRLEAIGWKGLFDAHSGFEHTVQILRDISKNI